MTKYPLPLPPADLLCKFNEVVNDIVAALRTFMLKNRNLRATRDLLLPKLISGQLSVEDLDIDVGEAIADLEEPTAVSVEPTVSLASEGSCQATPQQIKTYEPTPIDELETVQIMAEFR